MRSYEAWLDRYRDELELSYYESASPLSFEEWSRTRYAMYCNPA